LGEAWRNHDIDEKTTQFRQRVSALLVSFQLPDTWTHGYICFQNSTFISSTPRGDLQYIHTE